MLAEIAAPVESCFVYWQLVIPLCSLIAMGLTPLISAEWNWRVPVTDPGCALSLIATARLLRRYFLNLPLAGIARALSEAERCMQAIEAGIERQTGKPLPPVVIESSGNRRVPCRIQRCSLAYY